MFHWPQNQYVTQAVTFVTNDQRCEGINKLEICYGSIDDLSVEDSTFINSFLTNVNVRLRVACGDPPLFGSWCSDARNLGQCSHKMTAVAALFNDRPVVSCALSIAVRR